MSIKWVTHCCKPENIYCPLLLTLYAVIHLLGAVWYISAWPQQEPAGVVRLPQLAQASEGLHTSLVHHCELQWWTDPPGRNCFGLQGAWAVSLSNECSLWCSHLWALCSANDRALGVSCWQPELATMDELFYKQCAQMLFIQGCCTDFELNVLTLTLSEKYTVYDCI